MAIDISPAVETRLREQAKRSGQEPGALADAVLTVFLNSGLALPSQTLRRESFDETLAATFTQYDTALRRLADASGKEDEPARIP